jgi:hypothetical protein
MAFINKLKAASASFVERCSRYDRSGSGLPVLDDIQRHWIDAWGASSMNSVRY